MLGARSESPHGTPHLAIEDVSAAAEVHPNAQKVFSDTPKTPLSKRFVTEMIGMAMLLATVVASGIMGERLPGGNATFPLLEKLSQLEPCLSH